MPKAKRPKTKISKGVVLRTGSGKYVCEDDEHGRYYEGELEDARVVSASSPTALRHFRQDWVDPVEEVEVIVETVIRIRLQGARK